MTKRLTADIEDELHDYLTKLKKEQRKPIWESVEEAIRLLIKKESKK